MAYTYYDVETGDLILSEFNNMALKIKFTAWAKITHKIDDNKANADIIIPTIYCNQGMINHIVKMQIEQGLSLVNVAVFYQSIKDVFKKRPSNTYPIGMNNFLIFGKERLAFI